jgi:hypothetical protein
MSSNEASGVEKVVGPSQAGAADAPGAAMARARTTRAAATRRMRATYHRAAAAAEGFKPRRAKADEAKGWTIK